VLRNRVLLENLIVAELFNMKIRTVYEIEWPYIDIAERMMWKAVARYQKELSPETLYRLQEPYMFM
jgi:hypothetical protein